MANNLVHERIEPSSYIDVEFSEQCQNEPELYLRAMLDACASAVAVLDESGLILYVNRAWRQLAVRHALAQDLRGAGLKYFEVCRQISGASPEEAAAITDGITQILLGWELEFQKEYSCHDSNGRGRGLIHAARFDLPSAFRILVTHDLMTSQMTSHKQASEELETDDEYLRNRTGEALSNLSGLLINAQEEERKRIARELHDDLNQRMALLSIELEQLGQKLQKPRNLRPLVQNLQTKAREICAEIHRISYRLHPSKLDHLGLMAAVGSLCEELCGRSQLKIEFQQSGFPTTIPKDVSLCVFRIAQESLRNCLKHSGAKRAQVVLEKIEGAVRLSVSDNGCGFDIESDAMKKGLGFTSMRERLRLVGGGMHIYSRPWGGTRIEISVPLRGEAETNAVRLSEQDFSPTNA